jgi:hypothetical protein
MRPRLANTAQQSQGQTLLYQFSAVEVGRLCGDVAGQVAGGHIGRGTDQHKPFLQVEKADIMSAFEQMKQN